MFKTVPCEAVQNVRNHVRDVAEISFTKTARCTCRRANANSAGLDRRQGIEGNSIFVASDARTLEALVRIFSCEPERPQVDQCNVSVRAAGSKISATFLEPVGHGLGVRNHGLRISFELGLQRFAKSNRLGSDDVHQRSALKTWEDGRVDFLGDGLVIGEDHSAAWAAKGLVRRRRYDMGVAEGRRMLTGRNK